MCMIFEPGRMGMPTLSMNPEFRRRATTRLMVERLTFSSLAMPFQSGQTICVAGSNRRSSEFITWSSISNGTDGGRPFGFPVAL